MSLQIFFNEIHRQAGAKMTDFAGYSLPLQYQEGMIAEHLWTRSHCSLFDVSHMGQAWIEGPVADLEKLFPADLAALQNGRQCYSLLLNSAGGIVDDLIITRVAEQKFFIVVNAARKAKDFAFIKQQFPQLQISPASDRPLLALQGPTAVTVLADLLPQVATLRFMDWQRYQWSGDELFVSRSGYTGEDGFEISLPVKVAHEFTKRLLDHHEVKWAGLGARDSLRLEAGLCLYGHDLDENTTPAAAALQWTIAASRRQRGDFNGAEEILRQISTGADRRRVGLDISSAAICRAGTVISADDAGQVGVVSSGGYSPVLKKPLAMGYVASPYSKVGTNLSLLLRGRKIPARVCKMPFLKTNYQL